MAVNIKVGETKTKSDTSWCSGGYQSTFYVSVKLNSQNINANTSNITVTFYLVNGSRWDGGHSPGTITVGTTQRASEEVNNTYGGGSWPVGRRYDICSWTGNIGHNSNGTLSIPITGYWDGNTSYSIWIPDDVTITETYNLPTIPREHYITSVTPKTLDGKTTATSTMTINVDKRGNSFIHLVQWRVTKGSTGWNNLSSTTASTYTVSYADIKAKAGTYTSADIEVQITTYNGSISDANIIGPAPSADIPNQFKTILYANITYMPFSLYDNQLGAVGATVGSTATEAGFNVYLNSRFKISSDTLPSDTLADYVIAQGTSGNWIYRKWASGIAECWGIHNITIPASGWSAWGNIWSTDDGVIRPINYPSGLFISTPMYTATVRSNWEVFLTSYNGDGQTYNKDHTDGFHLIRGGKPGSNLGIYIQIHATGRWK